MSGEKVVEQGAQRPGVETPDLFGVEPAVHEQVLAGAERIRALGEARGDGQHRPALAGR